MDPLPRLRLGISACLLGQEVRWDAGHKRDAFLNDTLGPFVEWVPVCPEVEMGLGTPREPIRLEGAPASPRLLGSRTRVDLTASMERYARVRVKDLAGMSRNEKDLAIQRLQEPESSVLRMPPWRVGTLPPGELAAAILELSK